jgi:choline dehydrogenase-like flavoprotein
MLPKDFNMYSTYKHGVDWPIDYKHLKKYYEQAELEIGVSGDVEDLRYPGTNRHYFGDYRFPMHKIPQTYLDKLLSRKLKGMKYDDEGDKVDIDVVSIPQGRNSIPNKDYIDPRTKKPYQPKGAVGNSHEGLRCEGNSNCIPICPVQAKYNAIKTLNEGLDPKRNHPIEIQFQSVVSSLEIDSDHGKIKSIYYKRYEKEGDPSSITYHKIEAKRYVLAGSAIENAKILLASDAAKTSGQVGRNLMDHPYMLTWALMPEKEYVGPFRGPFSSSGIPSFRDGKFRNRHSAFRTDIGNWGWNFPTGAPYTDVQSMVQNGNLFGKSLRKALYDQVQRQFRFGFLIEQIPCETNRITIDPAYTDAMGNYRPVIFYNLTDYEMSGFATAKNLSDQIFQRLGAAQFTTYSPNDAGYCEFEGEGYTYHGSGHIVGTHRMGKNKHDSVVNSDQKCWDHQNLYVVGCGSMPTIGTSNPTLTMTALVLKTAEALIKDLRK